ncbi:hypothetical protein H0H92_012088, partial [Tricholoma furcatifolium]
VMSIKKAEKHSLAQRLHEHVMGNADSKSSDEEATLREDADSPHGVQYTWTEGDGRPPARGSSRPPGARAR